MLLKFPTKSELIDEYVRLMHLEDEKKEEEEEEVPTEGMSVPDFAGKLRMFEIYFLNRKNLISVPDFAGKYTYVSVCLSVCLSV